MLVRQMAYRIYERSLARGIRQSPVPRCIALVISDGDLIDKPALNKLLQLIEWCAELGVHEASIYVSVTDASAVSRLAECIMDVFKDAGSRGRSCLPAV